MTARRAKPRPAQATATSRRTRAPRGTTLILAGIAIAMFGTTVAMLPGGYNPFGPIKALVLLAGAAVCAVGLALDPELAALTTRRALRQHGVWPGLALIGIAVLATFTSIDASQSLVGHYPEYQGLLLLLVSAFVGFSAYSIAGRDGTWRWIGRAAVVATLVVFAYALVQFLGADPVAYAREFLVRRVRSTSGNASNLGVFLVLTLPLVVARARAERSPWRWLAWVATAGAALALAWSISRGAWVGAFAGALAWIAVEGRRFSRRTRVLVAGAALATAIGALVLVTLLVPFAGARLASLADPTTGTAGWRTEVWVASTRMVAERPILGFGPASFRYAFPPRRTASMIAGETGVQVLEDPHNLFASAAVSAGVLALIALLWLLGEAVLAAWRLGDAGSNDSAPDDSTRAPAALAGAALAAAIVGGTVALQFHFATVDSAPLLAGLLGLSLGAIAQSSARGEAALGTATARRARWAAIALAVVLGACALLASGLVIADLQIAKGFELAQAGPAAAPQAAVGWPSARDSFARAESLAPWEPALTWARGRAGVQYVSATHDTAAGSDAIGALETARRRLPADTLLAAQTAEAYLVVGLAAKDVTTLRRAAELAEAAILLDPENGYRWETRAAALAALGETADAISAYEAAVGFSPNDTQAWANLARLYARAGRLADAARAQARAAQPD